MVWCEAYFDQFAIFDFFMIAGISYNKEGIMVSLEHIQKLISECRKLGKDDLIMVLMG